MCADPKCLKMTLKLSIFFMLLGSMIIKTAHKKLMKLTPGHKRFWGRPRSSAILFGLLRISRHGQPDLIDGDDPPQRPGSDAKCGLESRKVRTPPQQPATAATTTTART